MLQTVEMTLEDRVLTIETGKLAKQADGAVLVRLGDTMVLVTVVATKGEEERDFFPLFVDYREKMYAAGLIPGGRLRREGPPSEKETLICRLIDRTIRPCFPEGYKDEVQVICSVLSADQENQPDVLGIIGASAALAISEIPFNGPVAAVRIGRIDGVLIPNPTLDQVEASDIDVVFSGREDRVISIEGGFSEVTEEDFMQALESAQQYIKSCIQIQQQLVARCGKPKKTFAIPGEIDETLRSRVKALVDDQIRKSSFLATKQERGEVLEQALQQTMETLAEEFPESEGAIKQVFEDLQEEEMKRQLVEENRRVDGRRPEEIRPISCEVGLLPRVHGSALFTRGETQSLAATTLGTKMDEQRLNDLEGESWKSFMLHYNFPPFSVGETRPLRGPSRRDIGHGALAERSIEPVIPAEDVFPYTLRIVSDILESNGSSSMATVCAASLSLMDAGVPIKTPVAGISIGLVVVDDRPILLDDIQGIEDHRGGMDFKVAGTRNGITSVQVDTKVSGLNLRLIKEALERARKARLYILDEMEKAIEKPRPELSRYAPRIIFLKIKPDQIGEVIGPGGKVIRSIQEETGTQISIEDDGTVLIASVNQEGSDKAKQIILDMTTDPQIGKIYIGTVRRITDFGAFVEIARGKDGLLHISELSNRRVPTVRAVVKEGDQVPVKVIAIDGQGRIKLSRKAALQDKNASNGQR